MLDFAFTDATTSSKAPYCFCSSECLRGPAADGLCCLVFDQDWLQFSFISPSPVEGCWKSYFFFSVSILNIKVLHKSSWKCILWKSHERFQNNFCTKIIPSLNSISQERVSLPSGPRGSNWEPTNASPGTLRMSQARPLCLSGASQVLKGRVLRSSPRIS